MRDDRRAADAPPVADDDFDLVAVLDNPRAALAGSMPGGLARWMRTVEAVRAEEGTAEGRPLRFGWGRLDSRGGAEPLPSQISITDMALFALTAPR